MPTTPDEDGDFVSLESLVLVFGVIRFKAFTLLACEWVYNLADATRNTLSCSTSTPSNNQTTYHSLFNLPLSKLLFIMSAPVLFVLGAGPKIGLSVGQAFAAKGYKVALAARSLQDGVGEDGFLRLNIDFANKDPAGIQNAFAKVTEKLGVPSVVVYNGASSTPTSVKCVSFLTTTLAADRVTLDPQDPLTSVSIEETTRLLTVNVISPLIAAQEAVKGFKTLPASASRTFIATGNLLNTTAWPAVLTFGMTKTALAHLIRGSSIAYEKQGFKFYYADERQADGGATIPVSGPAAGEAYTELAEKKEQGPWNWTFVQGKGYVEFK